MTGLAQYGAQIQVNALNGLTFPVVSGTAPSTPVPGQQWVNTSSGNSVNEYNGSAWVTAGTRYLALCTADPSGSTTIAELQEVTDAGYSRVTIPWSPATASIPSVGTNSGLILFGPFTVNMSLPAQWVAMVTVASGTTGHLIYTWTLDAPQQVDATQSVAIAASALNEDQQ